jgi:hypothetical protein
MSGTGYCDWCGKYKKVYAAGRGQLLCKDCLQDLYNLTDEEVYDLEDGEEEWEDE